jgi:hypothetical protein
MNDAYIRYANELYLNVELQSYENEKIFMPTLTVYYLERPVTVINSGNNIAIQTWNTIYKMEISSFLSYAVGFLVALNIIALLVTIYRFYNWTKTNPSLLYRVILN